MNDLELVVSLLKTISPNVYTGEIPETQTEPSMLIAHVASPFSRVLSGKKVKEHSVWRITCVAELQSDVKVITDQLEDLDNSTSLDFQQIFTSLVLTELGLIEQPYRRTFYELTVYKR
jgi:hypothetical protein